MKKRVLVSLLSLCLLIGLMPMTAMAAGGQEMEGEDFLATAVDGVISLTEDVMLTSTAEIVGDLAIQLNGHTISAAKNATVFSIETEADLKIVGPGTVEGYRAVNRNSTSATISCDAEGSVANIAITDEVTVIGGSIHKEENPPKYQGQAEEAIVFKSLGTLTVSDSTISGGAGTADESLDGKYVDSGAQFAIGGNGIDFLQGNIVIENSVINGGDSEFYNAGNALNFSNGNGGKVSITKSEVNGGKVIRPNGSYGISGSAVEITQNCKKADVTITQSTLLGGSGGNSYLGCGIEANAGTDVSIVISESAVSGGIGKGTGFGNAVYINRDKRPEITMENVTLAADEKAYGDGSVIYQATDNLPADVTASGTVTVSDGALKDTAIAPGEGGVTFVATGDATATVGQNGLTVSSGGKVECDDQTVYYATATEAIENAKTNSTVTVEKVEEGETLPDLPGGVVLKNETGNSIQVGDQTVENGGELMDCVAQVGQKQYATFEAAIAAANADKGEGPVTVTIQKSGEYAPFEITRNDVVVQAAENVEVTIKVSESQKMEVYHGNTKTAPGFTLKGINFVSTDGTEILKTHYWGTDGHKVVLEDCSFVSEVMPTEKTAVNALYLDVTNLSIQKCRFENWVNALYTAGEGYTLEQWDISENEYVNVKNLVNGYWAKEPGEGASLKVENNTVQPGSWENTSVVLWDWAQYLHWLKDSNIGADPGEASAFVSNGKSIVTVKGNGDQTNVVAIHCDWFVDSGLSGDNVDAEVTHNRLVEVSGDYVLSADVYDSEGNLAASMTTQGEKKFIYNLPDGHYTVTITQKQEGSDSIVTKQDLTVEKLEDGKTAEVKAPQLTEDDKYVAQVGDDKYTSVKAAIEAAQDGQTVELLKSVTIDTPIETRNSIVIDGNGNTITRSTDGLILNVVYQDGTKVTVQNLTMSGNNGGGLLQWTMDAGYKDTTDPAVMPEFTVRGCTFTHNAAEKKGAGIGLWGLQNEGDAASEVTITGCTFDTLSVGIYYNEEAPLVNLKSTVTNNTFKNLSWTGLAGIPANAEIAHNVFERTCNGAIQYLFNAEQKKTNTYIHDNVIDAKTGIQFMPYHLNEKNQNGAQETVLVTSDMLPRIEKNVRNVDTDLVTLVAYRGGTDETLKLEENTSIDLTRNYTQGKAPTLKVTVQDATEGNTAPSVEEVTPEVKDDIFYLDPECDTLNTHSTTGGSSAAQYAISIEDAKHGSVIASPKRAERGDTVTLTLTPDEGYELDKLIVRDKNGNTIKLTEKDENKFTFKMPGSRVEVEASFILIGTKPESGFADVPADAYYAGAVRWAVSEGITSGTSAVTFAPNAACTRAQMVTFLWRASGSPVVDYAMNFTDVPADAYYAEAVRWAVSEGITTGTSATTFNPDATVSRGQTVTFLYRAAGSPAVSGSSFADVSADAYYADAVAWAVSEDITTGTSGTTFSPDHACTRAQIVTFLCRDVK